MIITLARISCSRNCPIYQLQISANGKVQFTGESFVSTTGNATAFIPRDSVAALIDRFQAINYFALSDNYVPGDSSCGASMWHGPTTATSLTIAGKTKRVVHNRGCAGAPQALAALENHIDSVTRVDRWINQWLSDSAATGSQSLVKTAIAAALSFRANEHHVFLRDTTIVFRKADLEPNWRGTVQVPDKELILELELRSATQLSSAELPLPIGAQLISLAEVRDFFAPEVASTFHWLPTARKVRPRATHLALSPVVFSQDSSHALVLVRHYCGLRCSRSDLLWLARDSITHWRVKGEVLYGSSMEEKDID